MTVIQRIFVLMKEKGISSTQLSANTGIPMSTLSSWKKRGTCPPSDKLFAIAKCLEVSTDIILEGATSDTCDVVSSGSNNNIQNGNNNNIAITNCDYDINEKKLIEKFRELDYEEQIKLMAEVIDRVKGKKD